MQASPAAPLGSSIGAVPEQPRGQLAPAAQGVFHVELKDPSTLSLLSPGHWLVVFWAHGQPVGQTYFDVGPQTQVDAASLVAGAIDQGAISEAAWRSAGSPAPALSASIVICTRDRPEHLANCLGSLEHQTQRPVNVVVVDNASRDGRTKAVCDAAGVDYVFEPRPGLSFARNSGVRHAKGEIVAYTDDDVLLHPRWLERLTAAFNGPHVMAVTGLVLPAELATEPQRQFERYWGFGRGMRRIDFGADFFARDKSHGCPVWEVGAGANAAFRRACFDEVGLFDERLGAGAAGCSEDSEYWHRILSRGFACRYEPSAVVFHFHRRDAEGLNKQIYAYMRGHVAALLVQFERTGNWGNIRRLLVTIPAWYGGRLMRRLVGRGSDRDQTLYQEIAGTLAGLWYYARAPRQTKTGTP